MLYLLDHDLCRLLACPDATTPYSVMGPPPELLVPLLALGSALILWTGIAIWI